jgi:condensation enzyme
VAAARAFWQENLRGAKVLAVPADRPRSAGPYTTGWYRFALEEEFRSSTLRAAKKYKSSPFMVLMAAFIIMLRDRTGVTDLVVPTLTTGRTPEWTREIIGTFYNFMPLRADISSCAGFGEVVEAVRAACLRTYRNELPFPQVIAEAPELMNDAMQPDAAAVAFQVIQHGITPDEPGDELRFSPIRRRVVSTDVGSQIPDGILVELDLHPDGGIFGKVAYTKHMYDEKTIIAMVDDLRDVLATEIVADGS